MNRIAMFLLILFSLCFSSVAEAQQIRKISTSWTSAMGGGATATVSFAGTILRVVTNPGATAPTDDYDVTLVDADGVDLFSGRGANRDTANTEQFCPGIAVSDGTTTSIVPVVHTGTSTLTIANAGDSKIGTVVIYYAISDF